VILYEYKHWVQFLLVETGDGVGGDRIRGNGNGLNPIRHHTENNGYHFHLTLLTPN